jgi:hypothetical protein
VIDPVLKAALAIQQNRGQYALLLGSGVSRSAQIRTGWEITLDLICRLALQESQDPAFDPETWYLHKFGIEPRYLDVLKMAAATPTERSRLLHSYFEPTVDERERRVKLPQAAHEGIARLVSQGCVRVILTTNFDRLLEVALEEAGITPTVVSSPDAMRGMLPLTYLPVPCFIIKLHGDYLDTRIKNTPEELRQYTPQLNKLLNQIFDEYGLIICGWSADWDTALRDALARCKSHRFGTFWADPRWRDPERPEDRLARDMR